MLEFLPTFLRDFIAGSDDRFILLLLVSVTSIFILISTLLFLVTVFLRIYNRTRESYKQKLRRRWDPFVLAVMEGSMPAEQAAERIVRRNTLTFLLYLEDYIHTLRGKERERLQELGRLSSKKLKNLLHCPFPRRRLLSQHLIVLFRVKKYYKRIWPDSHKRYLALLSIREMRQVPDPDVKKKVMHYLFRLPYISPVYISNILADMGEEIVPVLQDIVLDPQRHAFYRMVAVDTLRRMHERGALEMTELVLQKNTPPGVVSAWMTFLEDEGNESFVDIIRPYTAHPDVSLRIPAVRAFIELSNKMELDDVARFFNDASVKVAINAAEKLRNFNHLPHFGEEEINAFRWADIYRRMVY
jgi:hypothetical protein